MKDLFVYHKSEEFHMLINRINVFSGQHLKHVSFREHSINTKEPESRVDLEPMHW